VRGEHTSATGETAAAEGTPERQPKVGRRRSRRQTPGAALAPS
jgi:hypothetical protein